MRAIWIVAGVVVGVVARAGISSADARLGQSMSDLWGSMMMQMMGPEAMAEMMGQACAILRHAAMVSACYGHERPRRTAA